MNEEDDPDMLGTELTEAELAEVREVVGRDVRMRQMVPLIERIIAARQAPTALDREAVARAIDPNSWRLRDDGSLPYDHPGAVAVVRRSLEAADAVLALPGVTQAPTVAIDVETVAQALLTLHGCRVEGCTVWASACPWCQSFYGPQARAVVAADPRRTEAEVKAEALREAADRGELRFASKYRERWARGRRLVEGSWLREQAERDTLKPQAAPPATSEQVLPNTGNGLSPMSAAAIVMSALAIIITGWTLLRSSRSRRKH